MNKYLFGLLLSLTAVTVYGQSTTILVLSAETETPLPGATVASLDQHDRGWATDALGVAELEITGTTHVKISHIGFLSTSVRISPGETRTVSLEEDIFGLEEMVVTGAYMPVTAGRSLHKVRTLDQQAIESRGAVDLGDLLQAELNSKIIQDDVLGSRLVLQGISGPNVKILMDGVPLVSGQGGEFDLGQINMNHVERVEIVEGPLSVQYGTNALAGTVNIITKENSGSDQTGFVLNSYYESVGQYNADASLGISRGNVSLDIAGGRNRFEGFSSTGERSKNWNPKTQYFANIKLAGTFHDIKTTLSHHHLWESSVGYGNPSSAFNPGSHKLSQIANDRYNNSIRFNTSLIVEGKTGPDSYINLTNGFTFYDRSSIQYIQDVTDDFKWRSLNPADHDTTMFTGAAFRGTYVREGKETGKTSVVAGYDVNFNNASGGRIDEDKAGSINDYALFTALKFSAGERLTIQPALRYTYNNTYDTSGIDFLNAGLSLLPSFNLLYTFRPGSELRVSYGKGYRTPSVRELYYRFIDANHYIVGNTGLMPEVGNNVSISFRWSKRLSGLSAAVSPSLFFNDITNKIELVRILDRDSLPPEVPKSVPVARTYANISGFTSYGFNLTAALALDNGLRLKPGGGILARSGSEAGHQQFLSYEGNLAASYFLKRHALRFNLFYKYSGDMTEFSLLDDGSTGTLTLDSYHMLDLSASRLFFDDQLLVTLGAKNLFDVTDVALTGDGSKGLVLQTGREPFYPIGRGTTFFAKLSYTFQ